MEPGSPPNLASSARIGPIVVSGATGYTGKLVSEELTRRGTFLDPLRPHGVTYESTRPL